MLNFYKTFVSRPKDKDKERTNNEQQGVGINSYHNRLGQTGY